MRSFRVRNTGGEGDLAHRRKRRGRWRWRRRGRRRGRKSAPPFGPGCQGCQRRSLPRGDGRGLWRDLHALKPQVHQGVHLRILQQLAEFSHGNRLLLLERGSGGRRVWGWLTRARRLIDDDRRLFSRRGGLARRKVGGRRRLAWADRFLRPSRAAGEAQDDGRGRGTDEAGVRRLFRHGSLLQEIGVSRCTDVVEQVRAGGLGAPLQGTSVTCSAAAVHKEAVMTFPRLSPRSVSRRGLHGPSGGGRVRPPAEPMQAVSPRR